VGEPPPLASREPGAVISTQPRPRPRNTLLATAALLAVAALALSACDDDTEVAFDPEVASFTADDDCFGVDVTTADPDEVTCGTVTVPVDHEEPEAEQLDLAVATVEGSSDAAPIVVLGGGPGEPVVEAALTEPMALGPARADDRDIVLLDQRGVGFSAPELACDVLADQPVGMELELEESLEALTACREELADEGIDLGAFNHVANARDVHGVRAALDLDEVVLRGTSYGSHLALHAAALDPEPIEALVLSSPADPSRNYVQDIAPGFQQALDRIAEACAADDACAEPFGDLEDTIEEVVAHLEDQPEEVTATPLDGGEPVTRTYTPRSFLDAVFTALYAPDGGAFLPALVQQFRDGELENLAGLHTTQEAALAELPQGMYYSMVCTGEGALVDTDDARAEVEWPAVEEHWFEPGGVGAANTAAACEAWDVETVFDPDEVTLAEDVPTLLVTGGLDHVTPPDTGERLDEQLTTSHLVEAPTLTHAPLEALDALFSGCGTSIVEDFLADPSAAPDASCVDLVPDRSAISLWFG